MHLGNFHDAIRCAGEALDLLPDPDDSDALVARINRAGAYRYLGDLDRAVEDLRAEPRDPTPVDRIAWLLAVASLRNGQGEHEAARRLATEALRGCIETGHGYNEAYAREVIAESYLFAGDHKTAKIHFEQVETLATKAGFGTILAESHGYLAECTYLEGRPEAALQQATAALTELQSIEYAIGEYRAHVLLAHCHTTLNHPLDAQTHQAAATQIRTTTGYSPANALP